MRLALLSSLAVLAWGVGPLAQGTEVHSETDLQALPIAFRLPDRTGLSPLGHDGMPLMDAYRIQATPSRCAALGVDITRPYADAGEIRLDTRCDWEVTLALGLASERGGGLKETYYESPAFFLREADLASKRKLDLSFQWRRQDAGTARGFKPLKLFLN